MIPAARAACRMEQRANSSSIPSAERCVRRSRT
ncbi:Uncharacterised protein [Vibrio cholerae]|nr:Uncharacterised protein [Vibrio cholerae]